MLWIYSVSEIFTDKELRFIFWFIKRKDYVCITFSIIDHFVFKGFQKIMVCRLKMNRYFLDLLWAIFFKISFCLFFSSRSSFSYQGSGKISPICGGVLAASSARQRDCWSLSHLLKVRKKARPSRKRKCKFISEQLFVSDAIFRQKLTTKTSSSGLVPMQQTL